MPIRWSAVGRRSRIESARLYEHLPSPSRTGRRVLILNNPARLYGISFIQVQGMHNLGASFFAHYPLITRTQLQRSGRTGDGNCVTMIIRPHISLGYEQLVTCLIAITVDQM